MKNPKIITKENKTILRVQTEKGESLSAREVDALTGGKAEGLFPVKIIQKGKLFQLFYDVTGYMTLDSYLKSGMRKAVFSALLDDVFNTLQALQASFFSSSAILLSIKQVFVSPGTKKVYFIYVPIQFFNTNVTLRNFYLDIIKNTVFSSGENLEYIDELTRILNRGINLSLFDLGEYIGKISARANARPSKSRCKKCNAVNNRNSGFCALCGSSFGNEEKTNNTVYDPLKAVAEVSLAQSKQPIIDASGAVIQKADITPPIPVLKARIIQKRTGQSFVIDKSIYKVGKSDCDCNISDNPIVSRIHAEIIQREGHFFVVDLFSTNKTFVNGQQIPAKKEVELLSNAVIRFGNEEFEFRK